MFSSYKIKSYCGAVETMEAGMDKTWASVGEDGKVWEEE